MGNNKKLQKQCTNNNMEFNSPQPEYAQLNTTVHPKSASRLLAVLHQQVVDATWPGNEAGSTMGSSRGIREGHYRSLDAGIEGVLEEHLIPSPPLSPNLGPTNPSSVPAIVELAKQDDLWVHPAWTEGLSPDRYRCATNGFLAQYRCFELLRPKKYRHVSKSQRRTRQNGRLAAINSGGTSGTSDFEKIYRTRRVTKIGNGKVDEEEEFVSSKPVSRPSTPVHRRPRKVNPVSSPLASAAAVNVSQYIPNMSWEKLPDCCPSLSTLPDNNKALKVEWKGSSMDLSNDPLKDKLHPAELVLAQILRLPCDLYLDSKRRLFLEKVHRLKQGLPFRRTDAQKACRIDVNKASRLFAAYERIGWLDDENFQKFL